MNNILINTIIIAIGLVAAIIGIWQAVIRIRLVRNRIISIFGIIVIVVTMSAVLIRIEIVNPRKSEGISEKPSEEAVDEVIVEEVEEVTGEPVEGVVSEEEEVIEEEVEEEEAEEMVEEKELTEPLESPHPYANNYSNTWIISETGVSQMRLHFKKVELEYYDYLHIFDKNDQMLVSWRDISEENWNGRTEEQKWTEWFTTDTLKVELYTDSEGTAYGFIADKIETRR